MRYFRNRTILTLLPALAALTSGPARAQNDAPKEPAENFEQVIERTTASEHRLMETLRSRQPIVETYIEELNADGDLGAVPERDFYFLGKVDLENGVELSSFLPSGSGLKKPLHILTSHFFHWDEFFPRGFASRMFIDEDFDRDHYQFEYVRREFLGDVRTIVIDVEPVKSASWLSSTIAKGAHRRFRGRIWVEDRDYNIVRFNGAYGEIGEGYLHFDSWRVNAGPNLWLPAAIYTEENNYTLGRRRKMILRAQTRLWDYETQKEQTDATFTNLEVNVPQGVRDESETTGQTSPVEAERMWQRQAEDNLVERLQNAGLLAPPGDVDNVLNTVLTNLEITNKIDVEPAIRIRVMPTTPLESISIGHTIVISRGLIDVLPDEACLAAVLAHELAHIVLGQTSNTNYAFADRLLFDDTKALKTVTLGRSEDEEASADARAVQILKNSPYKDNLSRVGLFVKMLSERQDELPHLIRPLLGNAIADGRDHLRLASLMEGAPELQMQNTAQIAALPLGSRVQLDPWSNELHLMKAHSVPLLTAKEKMPFELTPFMLYLHRQEKTDAIRPVPAHVEHAVAASGKPSN